MEGRVTYSLVVARSDNNVIGCDNKLPWHVPSDLKRFKHITLSHPVVMGRNTFDSIGRPLPERTNIVVSRDRSFRHDGVHVFHELDAALSFAEQDAIQSGQNEVMIVGGAELFDSLIDRADKVYLTEIHVEIPDGDAFFSYPFDNHKWMNIEERHLREEGDKHSSTFRVFERRAQKKMETKQAAA